MASGRSPAVIVARLAGPFFVVAALGMLFNRAAYAELVAQFVASRPLIFLSGALALVSGLAVLNAHRAWSADWQVLVTVLGWLMVIGGVIRIVLPQLTARVATAVYSGPAAVFVGAMLALVFGFYFSFQGYRK
jgi:hypothetical protein